MKSPFSNEYDQYLIKEFIVGMLLDDYAVTTANEYLKIIIALYIASNSFKNIDKMSDSEIIQIVNRKENNFLYMPIEFLDFIIENNFIDNTNSYLLKSSSKLSRIYISKELHIKRIRELPPNRDIAMFQYYIHKFVDNEKDENLIKLFYSLRVWWHVSVIIPIRPSEITFMLDRNCIFEMDQRYYLRVNRIKAGLIKKNDVPILKKLCIDSITYKLISGYLDNISEDVDSKSLFSIKCIREAVLELCQYNDFFKGKNMLFNREYQKYNRLEATDMNQLINLFYDYYIDYINNENSKYIRLKCGDTRHLAFSSLFLQNINPIDIAMIGGHTSINSLNSYVYHVDMYMDSEAYKYSNNIDFKFEFDNRKLKDIILSMPKADNTIENAYPDDMGIGYCKSRLCECEDDLCFFCSHWWCRPTNENFNKSAEFLIKYYKNTLNKEINNSKQMLAMIFRKASIELINKNLILPEEHYMKYKELMKRIASLAGRREMVKEALFLNFSEEARK